MIYTLFVLSRRRAGTIHASNGGKTTVLYPSDTETKDKYLDGLILSKGFYVGLAGTGLLSDPYKLERLRGYGSSHYVAFELWYRLRWRAIFREGPYILINDWVFRVCFNGLIAEDGVYTKLG